MGDDADRGRLLTGDFERSAINSTDGTIPQSTVAVRYYHLDQSVLRDVQNLGHPGEFGEDGDYGLLLGRLWALAFPPLN